MSEEKQLNAFDKLGETYRARKAARKSSGPEMVSDFENAEAVEANLEPTSGEKAADGLRRVLMGAGDSELARQKVLEQEAENEIAARLGEQPANVEEERLNRAREEREKIAKLKEVNQQVKKDDKGGNRWTKWFIFGALALAAGLGLKGLIIDPATSSRDLTPQPVTGPRTPGQIDTDRYEVLKYTELDDHGLISKYGQLVKYDAEFLGFEGNDAYHGLEEYENAKGADFEARMSRGVAAFDSLNKTSGDALKLNEDYIVPKDRVELFGPKRVALEVVEPATPEVAASEVPVPAAPARSETRPATSAPRVENVNMRLDSSFIGDRKIQSEADLLGQLKTNPLVRQIFTEQGINPDSVLAVNICRDTYQDMVGCGPKWGITESQLRDAFPIGEKIDMFVRQNGHLAITSVTYEGNRPADYTNKVFPVNEIVYLVNVGDRVIMVRETCVNPALAVKTIVRAKVELPAPIQAPEIPVVQPTEKPIPPASTPVPPTATPRIVSYPAPLVTPAPREYFAPPFLPPPVEIPREIIRPNQPGQAALIKLICADLNRNFNCDPGEPLRAGAGFRFRIHHLVPGSLQYGPQEIIRDVISQSNGLALGDLQEVIFNGKLVGPEFRNYWVEEISGPGGFIPDRDRIKWGRVGLLGTQNPDLQAFTPVFVNLEQVPLIPNTLTPIPTNSPTPANTLTVYPSSTPRTPEATLTPFTPIPTATPETPVIPTSTPRTPEPSSTPTPRSTRETATPIPTNTDVPFPTATVPGRTPETATPRPTVETVIPTPIPTNTDVPFPTATVIRQNTPVPTPTTRPTRETPLPTAIPTNTHAPIPTATQARFPTSIPVGR